MSIFGLPAVQAGHSQLFASLVRMVPSPSPHSRCLTSRQSRHSRSELAAEPSSNIRLGSGVSPQPSNPQTVQAAAKKKVISQHIGGEEGIDVENSWGAGSLWVCIQVVRKKVTGQMGKYEDYDLIIIS